VLATLEIDLRRQRLGAIWRFALDRLFDPVNLRMADLTCGVCLFPVLFFVVLFVALFLFADFFLAIFLGMTGSLELRNPMAEIAKTLAISPSRAYRSLQDGLSRLRS
jgi:hypothetical protein